MDKVTVKDKTHRRSLTVLVASRKERAEALRRAGVNPSRSRVPRVPKRGSFQLL